MQTLIVLTGVKSLLIVSLARKKTCSNCLLPIQLCLGIYKLCRKKKTLPLRSGSNSIFTPFKGTIYSPFEPKEIVTVASLSHVKCHLRSRISAANYCARVKPASNPHARVVFTANSLPVLVCEIRNSLGLSPPSSLSRARYGRLVSTT